jgi:2-polyprenyl-3-methyl-5-hydroxy-6-metoxy-1,4-benzoquinol methylase
MANYAKLNRDIFGAPIKDRTTNQRAKFALKNFGTGKRILDIGCAHGETSRVLRANGANFVIGSELLKEYAELAYGKADYICQADAINLPFASESFDAIFAGEFIEHLTAKDGEIFLQACKRVLTEGGKLILTTPNPSFLKIRILRIEMETGAHLKIYQPKELMRVLEKNGFVIKRVKGLGKMAFLLTTHIPFLQFYGDYGVVAIKQTKSN